ncbi:MAG TPA: hypothetical protein VIX59_13465 [Candidatus Binataceae bacterium]
MKLCHAAALALVGWYLMMPPQTPDDVYITNAPLSHWHVQRAFDTATECENYSTFFWDYLKNEPKKQKLFLDLAQCISSDDPRLAK